MIMKKISSHLTPRNSLLNTIHLGTGALCKLSDNLFGYNRRHIKDDAMATRIINIARNLEMSELSMHMEFD